MTPILYKIKNTVKYITLINNSLFYYYHSSASNLQNCIIIEIAKIDSWSIWRAFPYKKPSALPPFYLNGKDEYSLFSSKKLCKEITI